MSLGRKCGVVDRRQIRINTTHECHSRRFPLLGQMASPGFFTCLLLYRRLLRAEPMGDEFRLEYAARKYRAGEND